MTNENRLVEDRDCGECTVCCVTLRIDEPGLKKYADDACVHLAKNGCGIYHHRPDRCRNWYCGWRLIGVLGEDWRPDRSEILLRMHPGGGVIFQPLRDAEEVLVQRNAIEVIGTFISNSVPTFISIPKEQGYCHLLLHVNSAFEQAAKSRNGDAMVAEMQKVIAHAATVDTDAIQPLNLD